MNTETKYQLLERSGMLIDSGMDKTSADRDAYRQIFGCEPEHGFDADKFKGEERQESLI